MRIKLPIGIRTLLFLVVVSVSLFHFCSIQVDAKESYVVEISDFSGLISFVKQSKTDAFKEPVPWTVKLMADIHITEEDLEDVANGIYGKNLKSITIGCKEQKFGGIFDGQGHKISGLAYDAAEAGYLSDNGLFSYTNGAIIRNLIIESADIDSDYRGGFVAGSAEYTMFENIVVRDSKMRVSCSNNVVSLVTDGGLTGGAIAGEAINCVLYNCESKNTVINNNNTIGVAALGGKGLYLGGLVGTADQGTTIEYSRVLGGMVKSYYDVAVGALGGNTLYVGGIAGQLQAGSKVTDCFATTELYYYTATYVSVGAGNSGRIGGIAAAAYGSNCEIERCHYAGKMSSKQWNAVLVIPIIQNNVNLSGLVEKVPDQISVKDSYFKESVTGSVGTLGTKDISLEYGPQKDERYESRYFWESHGYDFSGTEERTTAYSTAHKNQWVMDETQGIPVHGTCVAVTFDFPGAGTVAVGATELVSSEIFTTDPLRPAMQGFRNTESSADISIKLHEGYRLEQWYKKEEFLGSSFSAIAGVEAMKKESLGSAELFLENQKIKNQDLFIADLKARVTFYGLDGEMVEHEGWYDYQNLLPEVMPVQIPDSSTFLGWTTDRPYEDISGAELGSLRMYHAGDEVTETLKLYPVYTKLKANIKVVIEGHGEEETIRQDELLVGRVHANRDENKTYYVELTDFAGVENGYEFLGWYEQTEGNAPTYTAGKRISIAMKCELDEEKLLQHSPENPYLIVAKMKYRVLYHPQVKTWISNEGVLTDPCAVLWHTYQQILEEVQPPLDASDTFGHWGYEKWEDTDKCQCEEELIATGAAVTEPMEVYSHQYGKTNFDIVFESDFPGSGRIEHSMTGTLGIGKLSLEIKPNEGYRFLAWMGERKQSPEWKLWSTEANYRKEQFGGSYFKFVALMDAQINFYDKENVLKDTIYRRYMEPIFSKEEMVFPYQYPFSKDSAGIHTSETSMEIKDATMFLKDYYFIGWISDAKIKKEGSEWKELYDVQEDSYCTSDVRNAMPYVMHGSEICTEPQNLYPVYTKYEIETSTNVAKRGVIEGAGINLPAEPVYYAEAAPEQENSKNVILQDTSAPDEQGNVRLRLVCDTDQPVAGESGEKYRLISVTVYVDGMEAETLNVLKDEQGISYTIQPGRNYEFVANYEPLVLIYHMDAQKIVTETKTAGELIGEQPIPEHIPETLMFAGWSNKRPVSGWYHTEEDLEMITSSTVAGVSMELWPVFWEQASKSETGRILIKNNTEVVGTGNVIITITDAEDSAKRITLITGTFVEAEVVTVRVPYGTYLVEIDKNWNWREGESKVQTIVVSEQNEEAVCELELQTTNLKWFASETRNKNVFRDEYAQ